jgi:restriction system protein
MGSIIMSVAGFRHVLSEDVGTRSGLAINGEQLDKLLGSEHELVINPLDEALRVKASLYEETVGNLLYSLGAVDEDGGPPLSRLLTKRLPFEWRTLITLDQLLATEGLALEFIRRRVARRGDQAKILDEIQDVLGHHYEAFSGPLHTAMDLYLARCPFFTITASGRDALALADLYSSEMGPSDGGFFDQRLINFVDRHPEALEKMHWRQFERMTAEWLDRQGYVVELGPGRDDGNVDVRAWRQEAPPGTPPALIVQCKRQRSKVDKVVVKALWADLYHERADAGLVVTTNDISPGARHDIEARAYPIVAANRTEILRWVREMSKPNAGLVLEV